jgi:glycosyltransferase involved in cell wall biosynthesis
MLSLCMVAKEYSKDLERALKSVEGVVGEVILVLDKPQDLPYKVYPTPEDCYKTLTKEDARFMAKFGIKAEEGYKVFDFAKARNYSFSKATGDWILWLDDDDIIDKPQEILETLKLADKKGSKGIQVNYAYTLDAYGNSIANHWKTRLVRKDSDFTWKGSIHEDLLSDSLQEMARTHDFQVLHLSQKAEKSLTRNIIALLKEYKDNTTNPDPRILYYVGTTLFDIGRNPEGIEILEEYIKVSGWDEQIYDALTWIGRKGKYEALLKAIDLKPEYPMAYHLLGDYYLSISEYAKAVHWYKEGLRKPYPNTALLVNPRSLDAIPLMRLSEALLPLGKTIEALAAVEKALEIYPEDMQLLALKEKALEANNQVEAQKAIRKLAIYLQGKPEEKYIPLIIPGEIEDTLAMSQIRNKILGEKTWDEKTIAIFCPSSWEDWSPNSLSKGIGGSEEAVIKIADELSKLGYKVVVYGKPGADRGIHKGVTYLHSHEINLKDNFNIFICWRMPSVFNTPIKAKKKFLWLHDVHNPNEFTPKILNNLDKVIVLSKYHRSLFPNIPEEKIFYSSNGINKEDYTGKSKKNPHKLIYTSCPSRGLEYLLDWWKDIKKEVPQAELHVFYGFDNFLKGWSGNPEKMNWVEQMKQKLIQPGIIFHGRQPQDVVVNHTLEANIWAYPTEFPEISCITAMKMQACGVIPITSGYAALEETQQYGIKTEIPKIKETVIKTLKDNTFNREEMTSWARENFNWKKVAQAWINEFI